MQPEEKITRDQYLEAQAGVLGSLLIDGDACAGDIFLRTDERHYTGEFKTLFSAIKRLYRERKPIDAVTVNNAVGPGYRQIILELMDMTPTAANYSAYVDCTLEQARISAMQEIGLALTGCKSAEEAAELIEKAGRYLVQKSSLRIVDAKEGHLQFIERQDKQPNYIPWGFKKLNETVLSSPGDFVVLGGRASSGKTALSVQMAWCQAQTKKVGYFSLETNHDEIYDRLHAMAASVDSRRIRTRTMQKDEVDRVIGSGNEFESRAFEVIDAAQMSVSDIRSITIARGYQVIYLDYLQIISPERGSRSGDRFGAVTQISMDLHGLAVSLGVMVVALSQLSRPDRQMRNKMPDLYSLRESGQIEQDADAVLLLYREDEDDTQSNRILRIAKNKKGVTGGLIGMALDGPKQTFRELSAEKDVTKDLVNAGKKAKQAYRSKAVDGKPGLEELNGPDPELPF